MADNTYGGQGVYRERGGNRFVVASSGSADVESGGEIDIESGGKLEIAGTAFITTGGKVDLSTGRGWVLSDIYTTGTVYANSGVTSTGTGTFNAVTSTGAITGETFTSTGATSGTAKFKSVTSTGTGTFNAVTSTGTGTFNAVTSTGTGTFNAVTSTGAGTFDSITTTGGTAGTIKGQQITANAGFLQSVEILTSGSTAVLAYGVSLVTVTTSGLTWSIGAPVAGMDKWINVVTTTDFAISSSEAGVDIGGSTQITFSTGTAANPAWVHLIGKNTTSWQIFGFSTSNVTFS